jgi:3-methyladenine DNA glycosylase Tag
VANAKTFLTDIVIGEFLVHTGSCSIPAHKQVSDQKKKNLERRGFSRISPTIINHPTKKLESP